MLGSPKIQVVIKTKNFIKTIDLDKGFYIFSNEGRYDQNITYFLACEDAIIFDNNLYDNIDEMKVRKLYDLISEKIFFCNENHINCNLDMEDLIKQMEESFK